MKSLLFIAITVYATLAYAATIQQTKWHCTLNGDDEYAAFELTQTGSFITGTYEDKSGAWYPIDTVGTSTSYDRDGYWVFNFGYSGQIGHEINFPMKSGNNIADISEWKAGHVPAHYSETVTCY